MPEKEPQGTKDSISIIYNQKNDSPKYFEIKKSKILLFVIGLPTITLIALVLGVIGLIHTSPFHLIDTYKQNSMAREAVSKTNELLHQIKTNEEEKLLLTQKLAEAEAQLKTPNTGTASPKDEEKNTANLNCAKTPLTSSAGLSTLSLFKPIAGQHDRTKPATLSLSGFKVIGSRDTINLQFNIIPAVIDGAKLAGHIIVLMKNELTIQAYPQETLKSGDGQINYASGETFSTQRFRPVDASFLKPRKPGNYNFIVYIFAKNGDLLHYQSVTMPVKF